MNKIFYILYFLILFNKSYSQLSFSNKLNYDLFENDKNLHYLAGLNISNFVGSSVFYKTKKPFLSCLSGFAAATIAGWGKELIYDKYFHKGTYDKFDAFDTMWGGLVGSLTLRVGINIYYEKPKERLLNVDKEKYSFNNYYLIYNKNKIKL